jgi:hypothetical protein
MKTGRLECYIPSAETVSRDVKNVFVHIHEKVSKLLRVSLYSNAKDHLQCPWFQENSISPPMHGPLPTIGLLLQLWSMDHIKLDGKPLAFLLDIVEVPKLHSGKNLATAFTEVLKAYGIQDKV